MNPAPTIGVIALSGELDLGRRAELQEALRLRDVHGSILVDLSAVTYADSSILAELLRFRADAERRKVTVALLITTRQLSRLVQYAGLGEAFAIYDDRGAALSYLGEAAR
jgi:anti-sigma B factor antagonist